MIDIEALLTDYLRNETGERIVGETPSNTGSPWVKVQLHPVIDRTEPTDHLLMYPVQFDCYAGSNGPGGQGEAQGIAATVRELLLAMRHEEFVGAVVTNVRVFGPRRLPDTDFNPARQRYIMDGEFYVHS